MKGRNRIKSTLLALLLSLSMVVTYLPASMIAYAETEDTIPTEQSVDAGINAENTQDIDVNEPSGGGAVDVDAEDIDKGEDVDASGGDSAVDEDLQVDSSEELLDTAVEEATEEPVRAQKAASDGSTYLAFTSDVHNGTQLNNSGEANLGANRLNTWLEKVQPLYNNDIQVMGFCGDMGAASSNSTTFWEYTQTVMNKVDGYNMTGVYAVGNHEYMNGSYGSTSNYPEVRNKYVLNDVGRDNASENYHMYCLGSNSSSYTYSSAQITSLTNYLESINDKKPIIILTHFPLHYYSGGGSGWGGSSRTTENANQVIDAVNQVAVGPDGNYGTSDDKKIIFLWGHNHTVADNHYDEVFVPTDPSHNTINYSSSSSSTKTLYFWYAAAGAMSDTEYGSSGDVKGKGLVLTIHDDNKLSFAYYDAKGNNVTEPNGQTVTEKDPVPIEGVTIEKPASSVKVGRTLQLSYTKDPVDAAVSTATWSSSDTEKATVDDSGKVKGKSPGTVTITLTISDGLSKKVVTASTEIEVTEAGGSEEHTANITPSTSNPEQSIEIAVGDTLVINTTNGSSSNAYNFTATLSKSGVAQLEGESTVNIAAGDTGQFTVTGIDDGTVDITIQNNSSYGSSYARKGVIHLTVGEGGTTPVDPPTGDTVNITPTTDNPEESIKIEVTPTTDNPEESIKIEVGDTLTINVTNSSSNSAYDFTASLSNSGIAQLNGNATVNIAQGGTGQFTVTGLADGTVDITIQNSNSYGSQYVRKGVIHLTVGEGGTTPVDPKAELRRSILRQAIR